MKQINKVSNFLILFSSRAHFLIDYDIINKDENFLIVLAVNE